MQTESITPSLSFSTPEDIKSYLLSRRQSLASHIADLVVESIQIPIALIGGLVNHVWEIPYKDTRGHTCSLILKQYPPFIRTAEAVALPQQRGVLEAEALKIVSVSSNSQWKVPTPLYFDAENHVNIMEMLSGINLTSFLEVEKSTTRDDDDASVQTLHSSDRILLEKIAYSLSTFLKHVHSLTCPEHIPAEFIDTPIQRFIVPWLDTSFQTEAEKWDLPDLSHWRQRAKANDLLPSSQFIFGDFWPNSILVHTYPSNNSLSASDVTLGVIDWEAARMGHGGSDWTQMLANLYVMYRAPLFHTAKVHFLMEAFQKQFVIDPCYDYKADFIRQVCTLVKYDHWGFPNEEAKKATVRAALDYDLPSPASVHR